MKTSLIKRPTLLFSALLFAFAACNNSNDDPAIEADFEVTIENIATEYSLIKSGSFSIPVGATEAGPIFPGGAYEFEFTAPVGSRLALATMFVQSNDWFYSPNEAGIELYNSNGSQVTGDITSLINLYDSGTEADEVPGEGVNQAPRQSGANTGAADPDNTVRLVSDSNLPATSDVIRVTLTSTSANGFRVRIENVSTANTLQTSSGSVAVPLAPGVWAVHSGSQSGALFTVGQSDAGQGLEGVAEDGSFGALESYLDGMSGVTVPLAPGVFAVYQGENPLFTANAQYPDNGLEGVAEDGSTDQLVTALSANSDVSESGAFAQPVGASANGPIGPGASYRFTFRAQEGDLLNFATMFIQSNDLFYAATSSGIELFNNGSPISGDITGMTSLWDAGTELNEEPGVGGYQAPRQPGADMGPSDSNGNVRPVSDGYTYPATNQVVRITIRTL